ncbi:hypothetical protein lerEdw1_008464, partial [Lerista edwardsae]
KLVSFARFQRKHTCAARGCWGRNRWVVRVEATGPCLRGFRGTMWSALQGRLLTARNSSISKGCFRFYCRDVKRDTIFALSSGQGKCGVAVIRTSGPASCSALLCLTGAKEPPPPKVSVLRRIRDPKSAETLDRGLVMWFPGPNSFTGEDSAEFHVHGGPAVVSGILHALGCLPQLRLAEPGEFTKRAFQNGKLDLTAAEGLGDLIHAETEGQRRQALRQMDGELGQLYQRWSNTLTKARIEWAALAYVEAYIDFSEDDNIEEGVLSQGQKPVAIVSPMAGTTRDVVEAALNIGGFPAVLSDTAGLRDTSDVVEIEGVNRARQRVRGADLVLAVLDVAEVVRQPGRLPLALLDILPPDKSDGNCPCILILNKSDLLGEQAQADLLSGCANPGIPPACLLSCKTGQGIPAFLRSLQEQLARMCGDPLAGSPSPTQARHRLSLSKCLEALGRFGQYRTVDLALAAEELRQARQQLGRLTGQVGSDEILTLIFKDFCIGK